MPRRPKLVVGDGIHVRVVLGEVAGGVSEVPEEVGADEVTAQTPDVTLRVTFEHRHGTPANFIDIVDLPGRVMQERHRGRLEQQVVVVGGAPHECGESSDLVADLEPDSVYEEAL